MVKRRYRGSFMGNIVGVQSLVILLVVMFAGIMFLMYAGTTFGFTSDMTNTLISLSPSMFGFIVCAWIAREARSPLFIGGAVMGIGIVVAYTVYSLHGAGILSDATFFPSTLQDAMVYVVVFFVFLGGACAAMLRKGR